MSRLTLVRHGESQWNLENRFTGWVDVDLSPKGELEAKAAGAILKNIPVDVLFTSVLTRAIRTADIAMTEAGISGVPVHRDQALNERHYGDLQGLNKAETADKYGADKVHEWRRSYDIPPPNGESLKDTQARVAPYYEQEIVPLLKAGKNVLVVAHGNSLRALVMFVEHLTPEQILKTEIATGVPITYELDKDLNVVSKNILDPKSA
ncbi:MAG: 2,3-diphosphoglycerate-dependent phosphoglycerate mutase [Candidatus Kapabacteria bacterium]|nr:2,3-diphosphoglycerate-dependent phosphoglycerate mutase [Ignavibacteria bacterium]MBK7576057.1 2,3-diphosphoglycerate-dependent phosphoglycerate mutase [Ignavibacteria bacterium]MBK9182498.1 2,3-diphosphoglycerate-dependent phosphoglycerate mutase [Ignavibacteria bacterium]MBL0322923.1 2,3-diphosphoglycerate-dependent phosphoglycerate mutase [Ignavibacteria bacterium]MBP6509752.1 2,3-diphosphoglycerate-dependent phosphoglycerate mutase [Candidatus Kapabacteria bacterium]